MQIACLRRQRNVQGDHVGGGEQRVQIGGSRGLRGPDRIVCRNLCIEAQHVHAECTCEAAGQPADAAEADDTERLAGDLAPVGKPRPRPGSAGDGLSARVRAAQQQHRRRDHVLSDGLRVGAGRRDDLDAARLARRQVDVVEADPQSAYDPEPGRARHHVAIDLRLVAHDQRIGIG